MRRAGRGQKKAKIYVWKKKHDPGSLLPVIRASLPLPWGFISIIFQSGVLEQIQDWHKNPNNSSALSDCFHEMQQLKLVLRATKECECCLYGVTNAVFCSIGCPWICWHLCERKFCVKQVCQKGTLSLINGFWHCSPVFIKTIVLHVYYWHSTNLIAHY